MKAELEAERAAQSNQHGAEPAVIFRNAGQSAELGGMPNPTVYEATGGCNQAAGPTGGCNQAAKKPDNVTVDLF